MPPPSLEQEGEAQAARTPAAEEADHQEDDSLRITCEEELSLSDFGVSLALNQSEQRRGRCLQRPNETVGYLTGFTQSSKPLSIIQSDGAELRGKRDWRISKVGKIQNLMI